MTKPLEHILNQLGLIENNAVFFREEKNGPVFKGFSSELQKKIDIIKPDAIYVFNQQPFILFFDLTQNTSTEKEIHKQVWSFDQAPVIFIIKKTEVNIFNAFNYNKKIDCLEEIKLTEKERNEKFSFWNLQSGFVWKNWFQQEYLEKTRKNNTRKRANQRLFENIKQVREALTNSKITNKLSDDEANTLILRLIFIRYLIDRGVGIDENYINGKNTIEKRLSFCELIEKPKSLNQLFDKLNDKFNGVLFKNVNNTLTISQSKDLAKVFNGETPEEGTLFYGFEYYFEIFDFSIIPVEVISGIYESLIDEETRKLDSAVYTPSFLVEYILNDTVEKYLEDNKTSECKIFDASVGSGIFLVQSLRRMIDKEMILKNGLTKKQLSERIREIAKNNLFGIDINLQALKVTCFSIYIALLDYQEPKDIDKYEFPNLINENLFEANFFNEDSSFNEIIRKQKLNFILGNPPWKNGSKDKCHTAYLKKKKLLGIVSDYQLAQSFILRIKDFSIFQPVCSLIVTSKALYNNNALSFKKIFIKDFYLYKCFDLSPVRRLLFDGADNPALILHFQYANNVSTFDNVVLHQSLKYNIYIKYYKSLVLEKTDVKNIKQRLFYEHSWMFKVALYGNSLDYNFLNRIDNNKISIDNALTNNYSINAGNGIHKGTPKDYFMDLIGFPIIETKSICKYYTPITLIIKYCRKMMFI